MFNSNQNISILDLGIGSGCLLCSLLQEYPNATGYGIDISKEALKVSYRNVHDLHQSFRSNLIHRIY